MRGLWLLAALPPALAACTASPPEPGAAAAPVAIAAPVAAPAPLPTPAAVIQTTEADLYGRWQIVSLNGSPPIGGGGDPAGERTPHISFGPSGYGGNAGCNSFGGYGLFDGMRYYASGVTMTAVGCSDLAAQEDAIVRLMTASPRIARAADRTLTVTAAAATMVLRRSATPAQPDWRPETLAGTYWILSAVDGASLSAHSFRPPELRFEADRWTLSGACGTTGGAWRQARDQIVAETPATLTRACSADAAALDDRLLALLAASPRFVTGPNGEILIGGGDHWATGQRPRMALTDDAPLLAGDWRIVAIDGAKPAREPRIAFGPSGFSGGTGCNSMQGHYLAHGRRLFAPPPMRTQMACGEPLRSQEERIASLLSSAPRIAVAEEGEIALVDDRGSLRLRRTGAAMAGLASGRLWTGAPVRAELTMFGAQPLRVHYTDPTMHLSLTDRRWEIQTDCGRLGGVWRREEAGAFGLFTDPGPDSRTPCSAAAETLHRFFNGRARILVGESGELLVAGEETFLSGRVVPPAR
ncbi:MAG TPA: META domain-containing protein [Allosphingosinicella sp.]|jgi:heat shock protein HslJ